MKIPAALGADVEADLLVEVSTLARRAARRIVGSDAARDIAQDIVLELLVRIREGSESIDLARLPGLVCEMARCRAKDQLRRERRREKPNGDFMKELTDSTHSWMHPDAAVDEAELTVFRESSLAKLPERCRAAYLLVREEGLSYAEAGTRLGMSTRSVHAQVARAQRLFRQELPQQGVPVTSSGHGGRVAYRRRKVEGTPGQRRPPSDCSPVQSRWRMRSRSFSNIRKRGSSSFSRSGPNRGVHERSSSVIRISISFCSPGEASKADGSARVRHCATVAHPTRMSGRP